MATTKQCYDGTDLIYEKGDDGGYREYYHGPDGLLSMYDSAGLQLVSRTAPAIRPPPTTP
jgi:hypothetical protein